MVNSLHEFIINWTNLFVTPLKNFYIGSCFKMYKNSCKDIEFVDHNTYEENIYYILYINYQRPRTR